ncbi:MAG: GNAT family N-acetyltransferase [Dehalococcoidia bacterium]|nr:GNAT family N-acetyltransferase [Dehalococcoidia bacterium]
MTCCSTGIEQATFDDLADHWRHLIEGSSEPTFFDWQSWHQAWWSEFGADAELKLLAVRSESGDIKMIAPMMVDGSEISFLGGTDLVDYHDFLTRNRLSSNSLETVVSAIDDMPGIESIKLQSIPGNSATITQFREAAEISGWSVEIEKEDVAPRVELPSSWDEYLAGLRKKDRHELRRKLRRLEAAGEVRQVELTEPSDIEAAMQDFMRLHRMSTNDKAEFMTEGRERFFRKVAVALAHENSTRLCFLEINGESVATSLSFVCKDVRYLYNSGYNPTKSNLSVGLLNHALSIKKSIDEGLRVFDFMRGDEAYKYHLGGVDREVFAITATRRTASSTR